jgi:hypothetical protein
VARALTTAFGTIPRRASPGAHRCAGYRFGLTGKVVSMADPVDPARPPPPVPWLAEEAEWEDWEPLRRRRSRAVRVVGAVVAGSLLLATVGTTIGVFFIGTASTGFPVTVLSVSPAAAAPDGVVSHAEEVAFSVVNTSALATLFTCVVHVQHGGQVVAAATVISTAMLHAHGTAQVRYPVDLSGPGFSASASDATVTCGPFAGPSAPAG